jgi:hypothetical protein
MRRSLVIGIALVVSIVTLGCTASADAAATRLLSAAKVVSTLTFGAFQTASPGRKITLGEVSFTNDSTIQYSLDGTMDYGDGFSSEEQRIIYCTYVIGERYQLVGAKIWSKSNTSDGYSSESEMVLVDGKFEYGTQACPPSE